MRTPLECIQIEISGVCNARCPYCVTGQKNLRNERTGSFLRPEKFSYALDVLLRKRIVGASTVISLYNYGEPFLNPWFAQIVENLERRKMRYEISTNASQIPGEDVIRKMEGLVDIQFSVCGTSQESYDKIHGLSYEKTKRNIEKMTSLLHKYHQDTECILKLQMYKFNEKEYNTALKFAVRNEMNVIPLHAIYANLEQQIHFIESYSKRTADTEDSDQLWYYLPKLLGFPALEQCPQWDSLVIDEDLTAAVCCMATKSMPEYRLTDLEGVDISVLEARKSSNLCRRCLSSGTARSICLTPSYRRNIYFDPILHKLKEEDAVIIGGGPLSSSLREMYPHLRNSASGEAEHIEMYRDAGKYVILADQKWWKKIGEMRRKGFSEGKDFLIYNTYLRGEV